MDPQLEISEEWLTFERDVLKERPLFSGTVEWLREAYEAASQQLAPTYPAPEEYDVEDVRIETSSGIPLRLYTPTNGKASELFPVAVYAHGGGHVNGGAWKSSFEDRMCRFIAHNARVVVAQVEFRLAPEHPSPAQVDDCYDAHNWCFENAEKLKGDKNKFFTAGSSLGGGVAVGAALKLIDNGKRERVKGVVALAPAMLHPENVPEKFKSMFNAYEETWKGAPLQDGESMVLFYSRLGSASPHLTYSAKIQHIDYNGASLRKDDPYVFPCLHDKLENLPPIYMSTCGVDPVRDDAVILKHVLDQHGNSCKFDLYKGLPHFFWIWNQLPSSGKFFDGVLKGTKWVLSTFD
ncbi:MAG: hypothetical protein M1821_009644 [Bathelium mastoideum]|nr:MAG: hypothetical protein M1821_009644 [Bathelium mastoideum]